MRIKHNISKRGGHSHHGFGRDHGCKRTFKQREYRLVMSPVVQDELQINDIFECVTSLLAGYADTNYSHATNDRLLWTNHLRVHSRLAVKKSCD